MKILNTIRIRSMTKENTMASISVGDKVCWGEKNTHGTVLSINGDTARVEEIELYCRKYEHQHKPQIYIWLIPIGQLRKNSPAPKPFGELYPQSTIRTS
jgi:hypothetical protein